MSQLVLYIKLIHHTRPPGPLSYQQCLKMAADSAVISLQWYSCRWISERLPPTGWLAHWPSQWVGVPVRRGFMTTCRLKFTGGLQTSISPPGWRLVVLAARSAGLCGNEDQTKLTGTLKQLVPRYKQEWTSPAVCHIVPAKQWNCSLWNDHQHVSLHNSLLSSTGWLCWIFYFRKGVFSKTCN